MDHNELAKRIQKQNDEQRRINDQILEAESKIAELHNIEEFDEQLKDFENNKKGVLDRLAQNIKNLDSKDKKQLVEAMTEGRIKIITETVEPGLDVPAVWYDQIKRSAGFVELLKRFEDEGKINFLCKDGSDYIGGQ